MAIGDRSSGGAKAASRRAPAPSSSLHDIDDLYDNNTYNDEEIAQEGDITRKSGDAASPAMNTTRSRHQSRSGSTSSGKPTTASGSSKSAIRKENKLDFDVWVARKDKYTRTAEALANLDTERAGDDEKWLDVAVSLAATDVLLKTGKTDLCDCPGICREPAHSVVKQRTRCQCAARKCSLCKRCVNTTVGEITDKMVNTLAPYRTEPTQSLLSLAERIVATGEGKMLSPNAPKVTTSVVRMASTVLSQCSVLENQDGTRIQRPCTCPVRSLGDLWVKWTTRFHTFSRMPLSEADASKFTSGTRQMMEFDEEQKLYYMTLKWHQAAKPQKGDTAKIAARRALTADQKKQNTYFLTLCKSHWKQAQLRVVEHLQEKMTAFQEIPVSKRRRSESEQEMHILNTLGVKRMLTWVEEDQEAINEAKKDEQKEKADGGIQAHNAWVKRKDRLRIRMPMPAAADPTVASATSRAKLGGSWKPPRMDFSTGRGVVRSNKTKLPSSTIEIMKHSGLKYVHAMNEGFQGRGGDLEKCKEQLVKKGHIIKANFDSGRGGGSGRGYDDDGDNPFSADRYHFEKQNNPALKKKREDMRQRQDQSKDSYNAWVAHKALKEKALKYLQHLPPPRKQSSSSSSLRDEPHEVEETETADDGGNNNARENSVRWEEVGKALKAVDRGLLEQWVKWSSGFASATKCRMLWEGFPPIACDVHTTSSAIRDVFLKLLHRKGVNYRQAFLQHCDRKHKRAILQEQDGISDDMTDAEKMETFASLDKREFAKLLADLGLVLQPEERQRLLEYFDADGNQLVSMHEFLDVVGDKRRAQCHGDTDLLLKQVCMWETVCHECGMLNAFQLVIGSTKPGEPRMRAELPGHVRRRELSGGRITCQPECDMLVLKKVAPRTCAYATWTDESALPFLKKLELWSAEHREQHVLQKLVTEGSVPDAPALFRDEDEALDATTTLLLRWQPPPVQGNNGAAFYILETIGAEGTTSFRFNEYREVYRDPRDFRDNNGEPRYHFVVTGLLPNTKYGFRVRALNGFGAGPYTFAYFMTAPATPPAPMAIRVTANTIQLGWESSSYYRRQLRELRQVFEEADADGNGAISRDEFMEEIERRKPRLLAFLQQTNAPTSVAAGGEGGSGGGSHRALSVFDAIETDDNESISWDEFMKFFHGMLDDKCDLEASSSSSSAASTTARATGRTRRSSSSAAATTTATTTTTPISSCRYILKQCTNEALGEYVEIYRGQKARFTVHGLASGSTYQFRVQAVNEEEMYSLHSAPVVVNTLLATPSAPSLVESACTATSVKLRWAPGSARPCLSHEAAQARSRLTTASTTKKGGASTSDDQVTRLLKEWAQETSVDDGAVAFRAKFARYDVDQSGFIELPEFQTFLEELGVAATPERMATYMAEFDENGDGRVSFEEFARWWTKTDVQYVVKRDCGVTESVDDGADANTSGEGDDKDMTQRGSNQMTVVCYRGSDTSVSIAGLRPNTRYNFRLRTVSSHASSQLSEAVTVWTPPQPPSCAGVIAVTATTAQICWYPGVNGAQRFIVEAKLVETLPSGGGSNEATRSGMTVGRRSPATAVGVAGAWVVVQEGSESLTMLRELVPNTVYRLRVYALNRAGLRSEQSTVTQFCTLTRDEEKRSGVASLRASNAADLFPIECAALGDIVAGDSIIFCERLVRTANGKVMAEAERAPTRQGGSSTDKLATASVYSTASYQSTSEARQQQGSAGGGEPAIIGERTVVARVVNVRARAKHSNLVHMVVVWCTVQLYDDALGKDKDRSQRASSSTRGTTRGLASVHTSSHTLTTMPLNGYALATDLKIVRSERALYRYDVFRMEWQDEHARHPHTWDQ